jgi:hypothetical protein
MRQNLFFEYYILALVLGYALDWISTTLVLTLGAGIESNPNLENLGWTIVPTRWVYNGLILIGVFLVIELLAIRAGLHRVRPAVWSHGSVKAGFWRGLLQLVLYVIASVLSVALWITPLAHLAAAINNTVVLGLGWAHFTLSDLLRALGASETDLYTLKNAIYIVASAPLAVILSGKMLAPPGARQVPRDP